MTTGEIIGAVATVGAVAWQIVVRNAATAVAYAEKYYSDGHLSNEEFEEIAVAVVRKNAPWVPAFLVRRVVRRLCRARKQWGERSGARAARMKTRKARE